MAALRVCTPSAAGRFSSSPGVRRSLDVRAAERTHVGRVWNRPVLQLCGHGPRGEWDPAAADCGVDSDNRARICPAACAGSKPVASARNRGQRFGSDHWTVVPGAHNRCGTPVTKRLLLIYAMNGGLSFGPRTPRLTMSAPTAADDPFDDPLPGARRPRAV